MATKYGTHVVTEKAILTLYCQDCQFSHYHHLNKETNWQAQSYVRNKMKWGNKQKVWLFRPKCSIELTVIYDNFFFVRPLELQLPFHDTISGEKKFPIESFELFLLIITSIEQMAKMKNVTFLFVLYFEFLHHKMNEIGQSLKYIRVRKCFRETNQKTSFSFKAS